MNIGTLFKRKNYIGIKISKFKIFIIKAFCSSNFNNKISRTNAMESNPNFDKYCEILFEPKKRK